jgi:hypothetical protein
MGEGNAPSNRRVGRDAQLKRTEPPVQRDHAAQMELSTAIVTEAPDGSISVATLLVSKANLR